MSNRNSEMISLCAEIENMLVEKKRRSLRDGHKEHERRSDTAMIRYLAWLFFRRRKNAMTIHNMRV